MPFPLSIFMFSYAVWQASIERAFTFNPFEVIDARLQNL